MPHVPVKDLVVTAQSDTVTAFGTAQTLTADEAKLMVEPIKRMQSIVDITGVGVSRRQRRDAGLDDLGGIAITGLLDSEDPNGLWALLKGSREARAHFTLTITYTSGHEVSADWVVSELESDHVVGDFVMAKGSLEARGTGYADTV